MSLPGVWEFPGGKVEIGESPRAALVRELREELGIVVEVGERLASSRTAQPGRVIVLTVFAAVCVAGTLELLEHDASRWLAPGELASLEGWAPADVPLLPAVERHLISPQG